jgi:ubiquinone/menaquinone biosynthesis C-methylase UbiE
MRERAAQELNPEMGRMGAEDPSRAFPAAPRDSVSFDRAADYYDRTRAIPEPVMARLVPMLVSEIPKQGRCLEIGVGTGRIALPLARAGVSMVGVDISREMLRKLIRNSEGAPLTVVIGDATRLPFGEGNFTSVVAAHVLHLIPGWKQAIAEAIRVLKRNGILIASRGARTKQRQEGALATDSWERRVVHRFFAEAGDPPWPPGADRIEEVDEHMSDLGASVRELPELQSLESSNINACLANLETGRWAACWTIDETTRNHAAAATRAWAEKELGDLDEPRQLVDSSVWHVYQLGK